MWFLGIGAWACTAEPAPITWSFAFDSSALREQTQGVTAEVRKGGCSGRTLFTTWISRDGAASAPGTLDSGVYGFYGRARGPNCMSIAEGCASVALPTDAPIRVVLETLPTPLPDVGCAMNPDVDAVDADDSGDDGSLPEGDASVPRGGDGSPGDDGTANGDDDAGVPPGGGGGGDGDSATPDAGPSPVTPCSDIDDAVVACYEFEGDLKDASRFRNDASGMATFEDSPQGLALRANGNAIAVPHDSSLSLTRLTVEAWIRPDSHINLNGETSSTSLIVDKDQQYLLGMNASGRPFGQLYRAKDNVETTTAGSVTLRVGEWVYLAFTYDGSMTRLYVDGLLVDDEAVSLTVFSGIQDAMHIGSGSPAATRPFDGLIDAVRISNVARSSRDICEAAGKTFANDTCE